MTERDDAPSKHDRRERWRRAAGALAWANVVLVAGYACVLLVGESSRLAMLAIYAPRWPILLGTAVALGLAAFARDRRGIVAQAITAIVALGPIAGLSLSFGRSAHGKPIAVLTWNVFYGKLGPDLIADRIVDSHADIAVLQASRTVVADRLRARGFNVAAQDEFVVATRFAITASALTPDLPTGQHAQSARFSLHTDVGPLDVIDVHPWSPRRSIFDDEISPDVDVQVREQQLSLAVEQLRKAAVPAIIAGDTNAPPGSRVSRRAFAGLDDAWDLVGAGFGWTFPAKRPWMRIDRVFGAKKVRFLRAEVQARGPSDHLALLVTLEPTP